MLRFLQFSTLVGEALSISVDKTFLWVVARGHLDIGECSLATMTNVLLFAKGMYLIEVFYSETVFSTFQMDRLYACCSGNIRENVQCEFVQSKYQEDS